VSDARARDAGDLVVNESPALEIIPPDLWQRVGARFGEPKLGTPVTRNPSPVSGILRCSVCGCRMSIAGQRAKGDVTYRAFACSANRSKGDEVCPNRLQISERKAIAALVA